MSALRMLTGAMLSVSRNQPMRLRTPTATIGIRGTGCSVEAEPEQTCFCTCYEVTEVASANDPAKKEIITATMHDRPVYVGIDAKSGGSIQDAPLINHTNLELAMIGTLVGRTPAYIFNKDAYTAPRRNY